MLKKKNQTDEKVRIDKVVTKVGDGGFTNLVTKNIHKSDPIIDCIGCIDEANAAIGMACMITSDLRADLKELIKEIQNNLFDLGADLICATNKINAEHVAVLDTKVAEINKLLPPLTSFVIPKGKSAPFHLARTIVRRAERAFWHYIRSVDSTIDDQADAQQGNVLTLPGIYLNRLSDLLFVICRFVHYSAQDHEETWKRIKD